jgi:hypothetical protein
VALLKFGGEIFKQLRDLLPLPFVFALIVVDRVLTAGKKLPNGAAFAVDLP